MSRDRHWLVFVILLAVTSHVRAAPPEINHLYPAGGKRGETTEVTVSGKLDPSVKAWCSHEDVKIQMPEKGDRVKISVRPDAQPGCRWLRFYNAEGAAALKPFLIGTLPEVLEKESNDELSKAQTLVSSKVSVNGVLGKSGDVDTYSVSLQKGQTLVVSMQANSQLGSPVDGVLQVLSPRGFVLEQNDDDRGMDPQIVFVAKSNGAHFIRVFGFPAAPNSSIRLAGAANYIYRLTVTTGAFVDHALPMAVSRIAKDQGSANGQKITKLRLVGWNIPPELADFQFELTKPGQPVAIHHPLLANTMPIPVVPHPTIVESEPNDPERPNPIELPMTISGRIDKPRDIDVYRFSAKKGQKLEFRVESRSLGYRLDPVLRLVDAKGKTLREVETRSSKNIDETLAYSVPADGEYRLQVRDLFRHGGLRFVYRLTAVYQQPDYSLSLAADTFKLMPGKPLEIPVTVNRKNGFSHEIEISVRGLPKGVAAKTVKSLAKGNSAKAVKLVLTRDEKMPAELLDRPIQIAGKSAGDASVQRRATAPITGLTAKTEDIWLTVLSSK